MHVNQVIWHEENIGTIWETSHRCCVMRKVIHNKVTAGGRVDFFLDSGAQPLFHANEEHILTKKDRSIISTFNTQLLL